MKKKDLIKKTQIFEAVLEHTNMMTVLLDTDFNFLWVNPAYAKSCNHDPYFFIGKNHFDLYPNEENIAIFRRVVDTGEPYFVTAKPFEFPDQPERGTTYWDWSLIPVKDHDGSVTGLVFTLTEVTDRVKADKALTLSEHKYRELVQNTNSVIIRWKIDGTITFFNEYGLELFGYEEDQVLGSHVNILLPDKDSAGLDLTGLVKDIVEFPENFINNINENILCNGSRIWMAWTNKPIYDQDDNLVEILAVGTDITALKDAELALAKSENEKSLILDNADELIAYHDRENNLIWGNRVYLEVTGKTLSQIQGKKCYHCWGLEKICTGCPMIRTFETGKPHSKILTPQNQSHWPEDQGCWDVRSAPVKDDYGNVIGAIEVARDITESIKTEKALRALASFPEENPNPVMRCSLEGDILYTNDSAQSWLKSLGYKTGGPLPDQVTHLLENAIKKARKMETEITSGSGQFFNIIAVQPPGENYINLYGTDVTERKKAEMALKNAHDDLDKKVKERTAELEWRNRELQEFALVASHDLQEPLRKIKLFGEMTVRELSGALNDKGKDYLQRMSGAADRMQKLIKALLTYSRTSSKESPFKLVNLKEVAYKVIENLSPLKNDTAPVIKIDDLPEIDADPVQMNQLFQNLLANAVNYCKEGQTPKIIISSRILEPDNAQKRKFCELTVEDNGIGFDMNYVDKIFLPFERLHGDNKYKGTGMGLAICRKIVERHSGQIVARGVPGEGSTFIVTLPVRQIIESI